jgi:hypothetical protein
MHNQNFVNTVLMDWASRSPNGLLSDIVGEDNLNSLHEVLVLKGFSDNEALSIVNEVGIIAEKGKHPERQAYNSNGILVTFPTPDYKQRAISKGTHFEQNPKVSQSNLFGGGQQAPNQSTPPPTPDSGTNSMDTKQSTLPPSGTTQPQPQPAQKEVPEPGTPGTPASPAPAPSSNQSPSVQTPAQGQLTAEPIPQSTPTPPNVATPPPPPSPPPVQKTPKEIEAEKAVIKQMLNTNDVLPTVPGVGGIGISEELRKLRRIALEMNLNEAAQFLSNHL